MMWRG